MRRAGRAFGRFLARAAVLPALASAVALAAPPKLESIFPAGGARGSTISISPGKGITRLHLDAPETFVTPGAKEGEWRIAIGEKAEPGLYLMRACNAEGASAPRWFSIGVLPDATETEPNDDLAASQKISPPTCLNGRLEKSGDVDSFTFEAKADAWIVAAVEAYALGSPVDAVLNLFDEAGTRIAMAHDGRSLDPVLIHQMARSGRYSLQISGFTHPPQANVAFTGGASIVYRLHVTTSAATMQVFPPAVTIGKKCALELRGKNLPAKERTLAFDGARFTRGRRVESITPDVGGFLPVQVLATTADVTSEKEPNNTAAQATAIPEGHIGAGVIGESADVDRFSFPVKKGQRYAARVLAKSLGHPLDASLQIESAEGKTLATNDDEGDSPDPAAAFTAPADGQCQVVVRDLFNNGGEQCTYVVEIAPEQPDFSATIEGGGTLALAAGKKLELKAKVKLAGGFKRPLVARMQNLPPGVTAAEVPVPEKGGDVTVTLLAAPTAPQAGQPVQLAIWTKEGEPAIYRPAAFALRGEEKRGQTPLDESDELWLSVTRP